MCSRMKEGRETTWKSQMDLQNVTLMWLNYNKVRSVVVNRFKSKIWLTDWLKLKSFPCKVTTVTFGAFHSFVLISARCWVWIICIIYPMAQCAVDKFGVGQSHPNRTWMLLKRKSWKAQLLFKEHKLGWTRTLQCTVLVSLGKIHVSLFDLCDVCFHSIHYLKICN